MSYSELDVANKDNVELHACNLLGNEICSVYNDLKLHICPYLYKNLDLG